jgi:hypothetical protein
MEQITTDPRLLHVASCIRCVLSTTHNTPAKSRKRLQIALWALACPERDFDEALLALEVSGSIGKDLGFKMITPPYNREDISRTLGLLMQPNNVIEVRVPKTKWGTLSGYFDNPESAIAEISRWNGQAPAVYATMNPVHRDLLARAKNHFQRYAKETTRNDEVLRRRWLLIDFDPRRPAGISSTESEHAAALDCAKRCRDWLRQLGWPEPLLADSGNGAHVLCQIDLPNDSESNELVRKSLQAVHIEFTDSAVEIDLCVHNAARITKVYGTMVTKGDSTKDRPHRLSRLIEVPPVIEVVDTELLRQLASRVPDGGRGNGHRGPDGHIDVEHWISSHGLTATATPWKDGRKWVFDRCPWNPDHRDKSAYVVQLRDGAIAAGCHHNGCSGKDWHALRDTIEPGWRQNAHDSSFIRFFRPVQKTEIPWPTLSEVALHGLAGNIIRAVAPETEADPAAILIQFLVTIGSVVGRNACYRFSRECHFLNESVILVGSTAQGRKGLSWNLVRSLFSTADPEFCEKCIQTGMSSAEGLILAVTDLIEEEQPIRKNGKVEGYQMVRIHPGVPDKRLLVVESEASVLFRRMIRDGNTVSEVLRQAWDNGNLQTITKKSPLRATGAHISWIAHVTSTDLQAFLEATSLFNGFANRILWCCTRRSRLLPEGGTLPDEMELFQVQVKAAVLFGRDTHEMIRDDAARQLWKREYEALSSRGEDRFGAATARATAHVTRLSCIYALLDHSKVIRKEHLEAALAVWRYVEDSARYLFDSVENTTAERILAALRNAPTHSMSRTEISGIFKRNRTADEIDGALAGLREQGLVFMTHDTSGKGRPAEVWALADEPERNERTKE